MILTLQSITLEAPLQISGQCLVLAELILPRNGIARRPALKELSLKKGKRSLARAPFYERALLKEKVDGLFGLKVAVTRPLKHPELNRYLRQLLAAGIESVPSLSMLSALSAPFDDVLEEAADQFADRLLDDAPFVASGGEDFDSATLVPGKVKIPLKLTESIRSSADVRPSQKREKRKPAAKTYRKGSIVGELTLNVH